MNSRCRKTRKKSPDERTHSSKPTGPGPSTCRHRPLPRIGEPGRYAYHPLLRCRDCGSPEPNTLKVYRTTRTVMGRSSDTRPAVRAELYSSSPWSDFIPHS